MKWRDHLPDECPPKDALPTNGDVYRLTKRSNFGERDFLSYREMYPNKQYDGVSECVVCGISIYTETVGIQRMRRRIPGKRNDKVIKGRLVPEHGTMLNTPSTTHKSHHTWWIPQDVKPWEVFQVIELDEEN